jgi:phosphatidylinositol alpha-1,6-mannosyltransferase
MNDFLRLGAGYARDVVGEAQHPLLTMRAATDRAREAAEDLRNMDGTIQPVRHPARILMYTAYFEPEYSGAALQALTLAKELRRRGHLVEFVTNRWPGLADTAVVDGFAVQRLEPGRLRRHREFRLWFNLVRFVWKRRHDYDILHSHGAYFTHAFIGPLARLVGMKSLVKASLANDDLQDLVRPVIGTLHRLMLQRVSACVGTSRDLVGEFRASGQAPERIHHLPNGVDTERFRPLPKAGARAALRERMGISLGQPIVLYVGVLDQRKNILWLAEQWVEHDAFGTGALLLAVGPLGRDDPQGLLRAKLTELARANPQRFTLRDFHADVAPYYQCADLLVLPSYKEGLPNVVLEAMASGLPCVAARTSGSRELITDGENGFTYEPDDVDGLASAVLRCLAPGATRLGERARQLAEQRYSIRSIADQYEALYARLLPAQRQDLSLLMVTELFLPTKGGTAVSFDDDFRRLGGKSVHIVTAAVPGDIEFDRDHPNKVHRLKLERSPWLRPESLSMYTRLLWQSMRLAFSNRFLAVFAGRALPEGLVAWAVGRLRGCKVLVYAHGEELTGWGRGWKFRTMCFTLRRADHILSNSDFTRDTLISLIGVRPERIVMTYPTVDVERLRPGLPFDDLRAAIGLSDGQRLILSVGRLQRRKGFDQVVRALPGLLARGIDVHYAIVGIGDDREYLLGLAHEAGVTDRLHLLGHVAPADLPRWYNACDLFAMPNRDINGDTEGFGLVFMEANACAKPVIAGRAGGTGSAVEDGLNGLRVDGEDVAAVEAGIAHLLQNPEEARRMGQAGRDRTATRFTSDQRAELIRQIVLSR